tara:strand:- start:3091 stop:3396 length:306 start_codon:yes stop_codon:yes gene_type:complete
MASINRKIQGKDKDITYHIDGQLAGVVMNNNLYVGISEDPTKSELKAYNAMLKKAKARDGVKGAIAGVGTVLMDDGEVTIRFNGSNFPVTDFLKDVETVAA